MVTAGVLKANDQLRAAEKVDAVVDPLDGQRHHAEKNDACGNRVPDLPLAHEIDVCFAEETHVI